MSHVDEAHVSWQTSVFCGVSTTFRALCDVVDADCGSNDGDDDDACNRNSSSSSTTTRTPTSAHALLDRRLATLERLCNNSTVLDGDDDDKNKGGGDAVTSRTRQEQRQQQLLREAAACVYGAVHVQVSILDEDVNDAADIHDDDDDAYVEDLWSPLYLAIHTTHTAAVARLLAFHETFAVPVMEQLLRDADDAAATTATTSAAAVVVGPPLRCVTLPSWGGVVALLSCHDDTACCSSNDKDSKKCNEAHARAMAAATEALLSDSYDGRACIASVLSFVRPLVQWALHDALQSSSRAATAAAAAAETATTSDEVVRAWLQRGSHDASTHARLPSLIVAADDVYEMCTAAVAARSTDDNSDTNEVSVLMHVLGCFAGALVPVLRGRDVCSCHNNNNSSNATTSATASAAANNGSGNSSLCRHQRHGSTSSRCSTAHTPTASHVHSRAASLSLVPPTQQQLQQQQQQQHMSFGASPPPMTGSFATMTTTTTTMATGTTSAAAAAVADAMSLSACNLAMAVTTTTSCEAFWLTCAAQEPARLALYALWVDKRQYAYDANSSTRLRRTARLLQECHSAQALLRRARYNSNNNSNNNSSNAALRCVWSAQLLVTAQLCSSTATLEDFVDMLGDAEDDEDEAAVEAACASAAATATAAVTTNTATTTTQQHTQQPSAAHEASEGRRSGSGDSSSSSNNDNNYTRQMRSDGGDDDKGSVQNMPGAVMSLLAAGVVAAARVCDAAALQLLERKVAAMLCSSCGPRRLGGVRAYLLACPVSHAERFAVLWLRHTAMMTTRAATTGNNNKGSHSEHAGAVAASSSSDVEGELRKYQTRIDVLYACVVDAVLTRAERTWSSSPAAATAKRDGAAEAVCQARVSALASWLQLWCGMLAALRDAAQQRQVHTRSSSVCSTTSSNGGSEHATAMTTTTHTACEPPQLFDGLLQQLRARLQHGRAPLPMLYTRLHAHLSPDEQASNDNNNNNNGNGNNNTHHDPATVGDDTHDVSVAFDAAQRRFAQMATAQSNDVKLRFYALYKQATIGDVNVAQPWRFDLEGRAKWQAWQRCHGMTRDAAMRAYITALQSLTGRDDDDKKQ